MIAMEKYDKNEDKNMIFLVLATVCSCGMGVMIRYAEQHCDNMKAVTVFNYLICVVLSFALMPNKEAIFSANGAKFALYLGLLNGLLFFGCLLLFQLNIRKNGTPITVSFSHLGVLLPTVLSLVLFNERPSSFQWVGIVLAVIAIVVINYEKKSKLTSNLSFKTGLILLFFVGGLTDMMSKVYENYGNHQLGSTFLLFTFIVALCASFCWFMLTNRKVGPKEIIFGIGMGLFNYLSTFFLLQSLIKLPAFLVYPVYSVGVIIVINFINYFLMKEPISKKQYIGMIIIAIALACLNS